MNINIYVKIGRREGVIGWNGRELIIGVDAPPVKGAANEKLVEIITDWLDIKNKQVDIISGATSRHKIINIETSQERFDLYIKDVPRLPTQGQLL